jgi:hypothetical protein
MLPSKKPVGELIPDKIDRIGKKFVKEIPKNLDPAESVVDLSNLGFHPLLDLNNLVIPPGSQLSDGIVERTDYISDC